MKNNADNSFKHTLKYTSIFGSVQGLNILIGLIRNKLVALILGPAGMGLISLYNSTTTLISNATSFGLSMSGVKTVSEEFDSKVCSTRLRETVKLIRSLSLLFALFGTIVCILLCDLLSSWTFGDHTHAWAFAALSPMIGMMAVTTGEMAILKGVRKLKQIATISLFNVVAAVIISIPLFYIYGLSGIIPSFLLLTLTQLIFTLQYSYRIFPLHLSFNTRVLKRGSDMLRLGVAFITASLFGSGADFIIRLFINNISSLNMVGLYNAGYMITMVYGGLVFSAMETDYFPRLSSVPNNDYAERNNVANRQIEISLLLISPMLTAFIIFLPIIIPLLFSSQFNAVLPMVQITVLAMYLRALKLPLAYIPLALGDSRTYLFVEGSYAVILTAMMYFLFSQFTLIGAGCALLAAGAVEFFIVYIFCRRKYSYRMPNSVISLAARQLPLGISAYLISQTAMGIAYWIVGGIVILASLIISICRLNRETDLLDFLKRKLHF